MAEKRFIGLDFTNNEVRMVQVSGKGKSLVLERYAAGVVPAGVFQSGRVVETARFADVIKELIRTHKFSSKKCVVGISGKYGVTRIISLPKMGAAQTRDAIQLQLNQYVPFPPGDTLFDYKVLREVKEEETTNQEILLVATRRSTMDPIMKSLKMAGLNVVGVKITTLTGFNLFESQYFDAEQAVAFVDVRDQVTDISFVFENFFRLSRSVEFGNSLVIDKIRQKIGGTMEDVEEYLALNKIDLLETYKPTATVEDEEEPDEFSSPLERQKKGPRESTEKSVRDAVIRVLGAFVNELMRSIRYFESQQKRRSRVGKIVMFGNIGYLSNLKDYIAEQTGLDTFVVDGPVEGIDIALSGIDLQIFDGNEGKAVVAISLASEAIRSRRIELNLMPREAVVRRKAFGLMRFVIAGYIVMLAWMAVWYMGRDKEAQEIQAQVAEWDRKIAKVKPYYDETQALKADINKIAPKVQGVLSIVQKQVAWIPILEELGLIQLPSTWIDEFSLDANGGALEVHGFALKTSNLQRFLSVVFYSDAFQMADVSLSQQTASGSGASEDYMGAVGAGRTSGAMSAPAPTQGAPNSPDNLSANGRTLSTPNGNGTKPMYGLPDIPRGTREIEQFWQGRNIVLPLMWEFDLSLTVAPQVLDTSSAAFEGLDNLSV